MTKGIPKKKKIELGLNPWTPFSVFKVFTF